MARSEIPSQLSVSFDEVVRSLNNGLTTVDAERVQGYGELATLRSAKSKGLEREQRLLALKYGTDDHPRIALARQQAGLNARIRAEITLAQATFSTPLPEVTDETFTVHGFVRRAQDQSGVPGLTLALTDPKGGWLREFGYACTDAQGYFLLKMAANKAVPADATPAQPLTPRASVDAQLRVFDAHGRSLHTEEEPVDIVAGGLDYRVILLTDEAAACGCTPPAGGDTPPPAPTPTPPRKKPQKPAEDPKPKSEKPRSKKGR